MPELIGFMDSDFDRAFRAATESPTPAPLPSREERTRAALEGIGAMPFAVGVRTEAGRLVVDGRSWFAARERILRDGGFNQDGRRVRLAEHDGQYDAALAKGLGVFAGHFQVAQGLVLTTAPTFPPKDAADAARINGIMADLDGYDVDTLERVALQAKARGDLALIARMEPKAASFATWKKPFVNDGRMSTVLEELRAALATPEVIRSDAVREWLARARQDVRNLVRELRNAGGNLDPIHIVTGAASGMPILATLFPTGEVPK